jgi:hypothetical protein
MTGAFTRRSVGLAGLLAILFAPSASLAMPMCHPMILNFDGLQAYQVREFKAIMKPQTCVIAKVRQPVYIPPEVDETEYGLIVDDSRKLESDLTAIAQSLDIDAKVSCLDTYCYISGKPPATREFPNLPRKQP